MRNILEAVIVSAKRLYKNSRPSMPASNPLTPRNGEGQNASDLHYPTPNVKEKETEMPFVTGSFSGKITQQSALPLSDQPNHNLSIGEVTGTQKSDDPLWNDATITYWAITDLIEGEGSQRGYYNNVHGDKGHEWGTFEGKVTGDGTTVEGTWKITAGDGEFRGVTGSGNFKTMMKSETDIEATWDGNYELARTQTA